MTLHTIKIKYIYFCFSLQFDSFTRSLSIDPNSPNFKIVTDGQLPLRQCLHPEACAKELDLPDYYWRFSDLRKEFVRHKAGDLSKALIPINDASKMNNNLPSLPMVPASIGDMLNGKFYLSNNFEIRINYIYCYQYRTVQSLFLIITLTVKIK